MQRRRWRWAPLLKLGEAGDGAVESSFPELFSSLNGRQRKRAETEAPRLLRRLQGSLGGSKAPRLLRSRKPRQSLHAPKSRKFSRFKRLASAEGSLELRPPRVEDLLDKNRNTLLESKADSKGSQESKAHRSRNTC